MQADQDGYRERHLKKGLVENRFEMLLVVSILLGVQVTVPKGTDTDVTRVEMDDSAYLETGW